MKIKVHNNNVDRALRTLKRLMQKEGFYKEMKKRSFYEKPSEKRKRKQKEAIKKIRKMMRQQESGQF
jgi:small subunit ribosomal protein S21